MIEFSLIKNADIFTKDFEKFVKNNVINFPSSEAIVAIYGPNGAGKTSFIKAMAGEKETKIEFNLNGTPYKTGTSVFHVINDQNNRNIIVGEMKDFFLGDNIKREFELKKYLNEERGKIIGEIISKLKSNFSISAAKSPLFELISDLKVTEILRDFVNSKSKGEKFSTEVIIQNFKNIAYVKINLSAEQMAKLNYLKSDYSSENSIIKQISLLELKVLRSSPHIHEIEENTEAITILNRFHKNQCIVCDTADIDRLALLKSKAENRTNIISTLDKNTQIIIEKIIKIAPESDPFDIKHLLLEAISKGEKNNIDELITEFKLIKDLFNKLVLNEIVNVFKYSELPLKFNEHKKLLIEKPEITDEDLLYVQEIINNSMSKKLLLDRDDNKNFRITLSNQEFLGKTRDELPLSTGEQNFLSLTFEFLKAKNSVCPIVIIDDPISSFDSIYKNKVVFAIVKMLHHKKRIVLTHNTDLLRLLDSQYKKCYKLYLLNNTNGEENGFISINNNELEMLISLEKLLNTFRGAIFDHIKDFEIFLISMVPFMRGYANIINNSDLKEKLTQLMHGYKSEKIDIASAYIELFGNKEGKIPSTYEISVQDILSKSVDGINIIDKVQYPLLDKTLRHSFIYLSLRLLVENRLVEKFEIDTFKDKQLGQIINAAYPDEDDTKQIRNRIRLTSKKTLINEFNHFEGNLSIFQPAIDITDHDLEREHTDIIAFINTL